MRATLASLFAGMVGLCWLALFITLNAGWVWCLVVGTPGLCR